MSKKKKIEADSTKTLGPESGINPIKLSPISENEIVSVISRNRLNQCLGVDDGTYNSQDPSVLKKISEEDTKGLRTQREINEAEKKSQE